MKLPMMFVHLRTVKILRPCALRIRATTALFSLAVAPAFGQALSVTLSAPVHHGFNISCFGLKDGSIHASVTGGTAPYTYTWSNGGTTQDVNSLAAGYYGLIVRDANGTNARAEITLSEPDALRYDATLQEYPNGFNVSCYQCFNGNIQLTPIGGVAPYTYAWNDGPTTQNRSSLGEDALYVTITDVNGCELKSETFQVRSPEKTDWTMTGNSGTTPGTQYIGTSDNKDVVFKSNGAERLRLKSGG